MASRGVGFYEELLEHSYDVTIRIFECPPTCRLEYLSDYIFGFTTDDSEISRLLARKAVEVCEAINNRQTYNYIGKPDNYHWFILMCNMPFFVNKLEYGTSIRGSWWGRIPENNIELKSYNLFIDDKKHTDAIHKHYTEIFSYEEWREFITAVIKFAEKDRIMASTRDCFECI